MSHYVRLHAIVTGTVQGIGFRWFVQKTAHTYALSGWVKNVNNGDVEIEVEGEKKQLDEFLTSIKTEHPWARVNEVTSEWSAIERNKYTTFDIRF